MTRIVLLGGGGQASVILRLVDRMNAAGGAVEVVGILDDGAPDPLEVASWDLPLLGGIDTLGGLDVDGYVAAVGFPAGRRAIVARAPRGSASPALVDPRAGLARNAEVGPGSVVSCRVAVSSGARIGSHVYLSWGSGVGHDCVVGDFASVMTGVSLSGGVVVGPGATVGTNAVVLEGVRIGADATVGAGAVVTADVPDGTTVIGVPARAVQR